MVPKLKKDLDPYQWSLPEGINADPDELQIRLDFYHDSIVFYGLDKGIITTRMVSARDISLAVLSETVLNSGLLPKDALWWRQTKNGIEIALWRSPKVWRIALQEEALKPARRFKLPMPGLIFVCAAGKPPWVYAVKKRPRSTGESVYHAPLFNVYASGNSCAGTHKYPLDISKIPESFFSAFFTKADVFESRSQKYPDNLLKLWEDIDGKPTFPMGDLVRMGTIEDLLNVRT